MLLYILPSAHDHAYGACDTSTTASRIAPARPRMLSIALVYTEETCNGLFNYSLVMSLSLVLPPKWRHSIIQFPTFVGTRAIVWRNLNLPSYFLSILAKALQLHCYSKAQPTILPRGQVVAPVPGCATRLCAF